jgi:hypothetical protein
VIKVKIKKGRLGVFSDGPIKGSIKGPIKGPIKFTRIILYCYSIRFRVVFM